MSKLIIGLALFASLITINAEASKARLQALGQDENGSYYIDDKRNVFLNPGRAYKAGKWANFEWGGSTTPSNPNAEGGMFYEVGSGILGLQLGRESNAQTRVEAANTATGLSFLNPQDTVNLIYAFKGNVNWGFQALYGSAQDRSEETTPGIPTYPNKKASTIELGAGVEAENYEIFTKLDFQYSSEIEASSTNTQKLDGKTSIEVGGTYKLNNEAKAYGLIGTGGYDVTSTNNATKKEGKILTLVLGYAHYLNVDADTRFYLSPSYQQTERTVTDGNGGADSGSKTYRLPVSIGMETNANDWLTLRASVTQRILISETRTTVTDKNNPNSTLVGAGAGINWKKLTLDGTLSGAMSSGNGQLDGDNLLANVGMTYVF